MAGKRKRKRSLEASASSAAKRFDENGNLNIIVGKGQRSPEASASSAAERFDKNGDLTIIVGEGDGKREFLVCSRSLARASPVFQKMLFGCFREARSLQDPLDAWVVPLPEDSADAAELVLSIVHGHFHEVPYSLPATHLHSVLVFTDKYDMIQTIGPWIDKWIPHLETDGTLYSLEGSNLAIHAGIAWQLGDDYTLNWMIGRIAQVSKFNEQMQLCWLRGQSWEPIEQTYMPLGPPDLIAMVERGREKLITDMVNEIKELVSRLRPSDMAKEIKEARSQLSPLRMTCDAITLGFLLSGSGEADLGQFIWGSPESTCTLTALDLFKILEELEANAKGQLSGGRGPIRELCGKLHRLLSQEEQPSSLSGGHLARMQTQRTKLSVPGYHMGSRGFIHWKNGLINYERLVENVGLEIR